jgi:hypothetical protein
VLLQRQHEGCRKVEQNDFRVGPSQLNQHSGKMSPTLNLKLNNLFER